MQECVPQSWNMHYSRYSILHKKWCFPLRISSVNCSRKLRIWSHLLKKSLIENFILSATACTSVLQLKAWSAVLKNKRSKIKSFDDFINSFMAEVPITYKSVHWFALQIRDDRDFRHERVDSITQTLAHIRPMFLFYIKTT